MQFKNIIFAMLISIVCYGFDLSQIKVSYNRDKIPSDIKYFAPHAKDSCQIGSNVDFEVKGFLYITKKLCGIESNIAINCPEVEYSIRLGITSESSNNPFSFNDFDVQLYESKIAHKCQMMIDSRFFRLPGERNFYGLGMFLRTKEYRKISKIYPNIESELNNESNLIIPISLKINNITLGSTYSTPHYFGLFDIKEILSLTNQEQDRILATKCDVLDSEKIATYCMDNASDDKIYPFSQDLYVNMREKPNVKSNIITRLVSVAPKGKEYTNFSGGEISLSDTDFSVFGFLLPNSMYDEQDLDIEYTDKIKWLRKRTEMLRKNADMKIVKANSPHIMQNYGFAYNEQVELYTKGLPINGWYNVYFIDKNKQKIEGYIHKTQLSWGF